MVEIFSDRVEITSPGGLPKGLNPKEFGMRSVLRNPNIANLFQRIHYIEKMGTGIRRIEKMIKEAGLPPVRYRWDEFVTVAFPLEGEKTSGKVSGKTSGKIVENISANPAITIPELAEIIGVSERTIERHLQKLQRDGLLKRVGPDKGGHWIVVKEKTSEEASGKMSGKTSGKIVENISANPAITIPELAEIIGVSERTIERHLQKLQKDGLLKRVGPKKGGHWLIVQDE